MEANMFKTVKLVKRAIVLFAVVAACCVPAAASARIPLYSASGHVAHESTGGPVPTPPSASAGFQWGDAGVGAAGMLALFSIAGASSQQLRRRRQMVAS
jgi:hypothetical protein